MCLLTIILVILIIVAFIVALALVIGGTGFTLMFGDVIVFILIMLFIIKLISKK